jgi:two-component system, sensor histidine kinase and response regulator
MNSGTENVHKGNILVVDDSPDNLRVLSANLTTMGYKVRCVTNGEMALVSIDSHQPDLILLDIRMPILNGYEVCKRIKTNPKTKDIPIIFLSALDDVLDKVKAFEIGGSDYVTKPFHSEEILARIANQLTIQRLQNQLATQNQQLRQEIEAHKQTEAALQDAKESAEIANRAKSNFIARMSHELRTPLNTILGFSGLMGHDSSLSEEHKDHASSIHQSARHLLHLINQILSITREESSQISLHEQVFNLHSFLKAMASDWQVMAQEEGLAFNLVFDSEIPVYICSDDSKLRQVLIQLLKNAVQFTTSGQITLRVNLEGGQRECMSSSEHYRDISSEKTLHLFFEVEDTGSGIAAQEISQLFQAFSQAEAGQKSERGLGLGLYISHQYIQAMGGHITIASSPNQGTKARFYIPIQLASIELDEAKATPHLDAEIVTDEASNDGVLLSDNSLDTVEKLIVEALGSELSMGWVAQLNRAATQGFDHQVAKLIQDIPSVYSSLARVLTEWNKNFQFEQIITITQRVLEQSLGG